MLRKKDLKLLTTEKETEGKSKKIVLCGNLKEKLRECCKGGVTVADNVEALGVDLRTRVNVHARKSSRLWLPRLGQKERGFVNGTQKKRSMDEPGFRGGDKREDLQKR